MTTVRIQKQFDHPDTSVNKTKRAQDERNVNWSRVPDLTDLELVTFEERHLPQLLDLDHVILARDTDPYEIAIIEKGRRHADNQISFYRYEFQTRDGSVLLKGQTEQTYLNTTRLRVHDVTQNDVIGFEREYSLGANCRGFCATLLCCCCSCSYMSPYVNNRIDITLPGQSKCSVNFTGSSRAPSFTVRNEKDADILLVDYTTGHVHGGEGGEKIGEVVTNVEGKWQSWTYHQISFHKDLSVIAKVGAMGVLLAYTKFGYWGLDS